MELRIIVGRGAFTPPNKYVTQSISIALPKEKKRYFSSTAVR